MVDDARTKKMIELPNETANRFAVRDVVVIFVNHDGSVEMTSTKMCEHRMYAITYAALEGILEVFPDADKDHDEGVGEHGPH